MTGEENLHWLNREIETWESECKSKHPIKEALYAARKSLEQDSKTAHWIVNKEKSLAICSNCRFHLKDKDEIKLLGTFTQGYNYCPTCRAKMQETESERRSYNKGVASVWKAIAKVTPRKGDYTLLFNAVHGTEKHPNGFNVKIDLMSESEVKANENEK